MAITPAGTESPVQYTALNLIEDAMIEIGIKAPGDPVDADVGQWAFRKLNDLIDTWQVMRNKVYSYQFVVYTLVPGVNPILLGPSPAANWKIPQRPVRIESAALLLNFQTPVDIPINIRDKDWWALNQVKNIQTNVPTDLYPDYTWPDLSLYFWPVSNANNQVRLQFWGVIQQFASINDPVGGPSGPGTLPQGYRNALKLTLAELLCPGSKIEVPTTLVSAAAIARAAIEGQNSQSPRISLQDSGMPKSGKTKGDWNWMTGNYPGGRPE